MRTAAALHAVIRHNEGGEWPADHTVGAGSATCWCKPQVVNVVDLLRKNLAQQAAPKQAQAPAPEMSAAEKLRKRLTGA